MLVIDAQVLTVAIPSLTEDLGATAQDVQWINASYLLVLAGLLLTGGSLADRFGRRRGMIAGLAVFGLASLAAACAPSATALIVARAAMGVGAALVLPCTLSILITVFDDDERPKAIAAWSAVAMAGLVGGPVLGGVLITHFWWGSVFLINVPVAVVSAAAALTLMPESRGPARRLDLPGAALSVTGMAALVWTIISLPERGLEAPVVLSAVAAVLALGGFWTWERRSSAPTLPLALFDSRRFSGSCLSLTLVYVAYGGMLLALTQYLQFVLGYSPLEAGLALLPLAATLTVASSLGATLGRRIGDRALMVGGFVLMGEVPEELAGVGSAVNDTMQQMGSTLGIAVLGSVLTAGYAAAMPEGAPKAARHSIGEALAIGGVRLTDTARDAFVDGMALTFVVAAVAVLGAAVLSLVAVRGRTISG